MFRILNDLQAKNGSALNALQTEISDAPDLLNIVGQLGSILQKEGQRVKSAGRCAVEQHLDNFKAREMN